jgi:hypothetical protein
MASDYLDYAQLAATDPWCVVDSLFPLVAHLTGRRWGRSGNFSLGQGVAVSTPDCCDQALATPVYWHEGGGWALPGLSGELRFRLVGCGVSLLVIMRGNLVLTGLGLFGWTLSCRCRSGLSVSF